MKGLFEQVGAVGAGTLGPRQQLSTALLLYLLQGAVQPAPYTFSQELSPLSSKGPFFFGMYGIHRQSGYKRH